MCPSILIGLFLSACFRLPASVWAILTAVSDLYILSAASGRPTLAEVSGCPIWPADPGFPIVSADSGWPILSADFGGPISSAVSGMGIFVSPILIAQFRLPNIIGKKNVCPIWTGHFCLSILTGIFVVGPDFSRPDLCVCRDRRVSYFVTDL